MIVPFCVEGVYVGVNVNADFYGTETRFNYCEKRSLWARDVREEKSKVNVVWDEDQEPKRKAGAYISDCSEGCVDLLERAVA